MAVLMVHRISLMALVCNMIGPIYNTAAINGFVSCNSNTVLNAALQILTCLLYFGAQ